MLSKDKQKLIKQLLKLPRLTALVTPAEQGKAVVSYAVEGVPADGLLPLDYVQRLTTPTRLNLGQSLHMDLVQMVVNHIANLH